MTARDAHTTAGTGGTTGNGIPPLARGPVFAVAGAVGVLLALVSGRYGYFGDELYFIAAGRHLEWSYADQPPLLPVLAVTMHWLTDGSVAGLRLPATLVTMAGVVVTALIAREFGGGGRAQALAAAAYAITPQTLATGHLLATSTLDPFLWTVLAWLLVRWIRAGGNGPLRTFAAVTAVALQTKYLVVGFLLVLACCVVAAGPRDLLRRRVLWAGMGLAVLTAVPGLLWQARNGWPHLGMGAMVSGEEQAYGGGRLAFLPWVLGSAGILLAPLLCYGLWRLLRSSRLRPYRVLGYTFLGTCALFLAAGGRPYYMAGLFPVLWAAGATEVCRAAPRRALRWVTAVPVYVVSAALAVVMTLPVYPVSWLGRSAPVPAAVAETVGWPELVGAVARAHASLTAAERTRAVVVTDVYGQAGAVARFGGAHGLPEVYSPNRGYWYFGAPPDDSGAVVYVGSERDLLRRYFADVRLAATVDNGLGLANINHGTPVWVCRDRVAPWSRMWPQLRRMM